MIVMDKMTPLSDAQKWLQWAQRLQALAQSGLQYTTNPFDIERYQMISDWQRKSWRMVQVELKQVSEIFRRSGGLCDTKGGYSRGSVP